MLDELNELIEHFKPEASSRFAKQPEFEHVPVFSDEEDPDYAIYEREFFKDKAIDRRTIQLTPEEAAERRQLLRKILQVSFKDAEKGKIDPSSLRNSVQTIARQCVALGLTMRERFNLPHNLEWKKEVLAPQSAIYRASKDTRQPSTTTPQDK